MISGKRIGAIEKGGERKHVTVDPVDAAKDIAAA